VASGPSQGSLWVNEWLVTSSRGADEGVGRGVCVPDALTGRSEMAQEQRPLSITGEA